MNEMDLSLRDIEGARERLAGLIHMTPLENSHTVSRFSGRDVFLKLENLQRTGSFKIRGAANCILTLHPEQKKRGIIAASAGNHAQGVALGGTMAGIHSTVVMPEAAPLAKVQATKEYGANVILYGKSFDESLARAMEIQQETGAYFVHPYDDPMVIAGQGTVGLEILDQCPDVENIVVPAGGGGLLSGIAMAVKSKAPGVKVYGVQTNQAPAIYLSKKQGHWVSHPSGKTIADGCAVGVPGKLTWAIIDHYVDDMLLVNEEDIAAAMLLELERGKLVMEGAGAMPVAAALQHLIPTPGKTALVVSGGNIDVNKVSRIIETGLMRTGRRVRLETRMADRPGELVRFISHLEKLQANILSIVHKRIDRSLPMGETIVEVEMETKNPAHVNDIDTELRKAGYRIEIR
jgi:threonine dehydratase